MTTVKEKRDAVKCFKVKLLSLYKTKHPSTDTETGTHVYPGTK